MRMQESAEMYLETILVLSEGGASVRAIDVARKLGFSRPSVSNALKELARDGYIGYKDSKYIELTQKGMEIAEKIYARHLVLTNLLLAVGVSDETAREDACRIEHYISDETFEALKRLDVGRMQE
ncbi:MAG: metal-dependent transcriptional regulator [Eggerthellaceae bacterium]|nr:metal-dependent transcriptional regulator [Eggerthellaceae bacterium]